MTTKILKMINRSNGKKPVSVNRFIGFVFSVTLIVQAHAHADEYVPYYNLSGSSAKAEINPGLYPPLSSGEASPWQEELPEADAVPVLPQDNPWVTQQPQTTLPQTYAAPHGVYPGYGYQAYPRVQAFQPYPYQYYPYSPGIMPPMPYGYSNPYGGFPGYGPGNWNNSGFNPLGNNGFNPFNFSMPWPF